MKTVLLFVFLINISLSALEVGHAFHQENRGKLVVGKTTQAEVDKYFGKPEKKFVTNNQSGKFVILEYYFIHSGFTDGDMKVLLIELKDDVLIGFVYDSSHGEDSTIFNHMEAENIKIGHHIEDVVLKVGHPSGEALCPINIHRFKTKCMKAGHMKVWIYSPGASMFGASDMETHLMFIGLNDDGKVLEVSREVKTGGDL